MRFCDIRNNQRSRCYKADPKAEADNTYRDLDYSGYYKKLIYSYIVLKKIIIHGSTEHSLKLLLESCIARANCRQVSYLLADN